MLGVIIACDHLGPTAECRQLFTHGGVRFPIYGVLPRMVLCRTIMRQIANRHKVSLRLCVIQRYVRAAAVQVGISLPGGGVYATQCSTLYTFGF
jgi:hypothetical protein